MLVDPAISDPLKVCDGRDHATPLPIRHEDMPKHFRPYLLKLGDIGRDTRIDHTIQVAVNEATRASLKDGSKRSICGWLASEQKIDVVAAHLARHARILSHNRFRLFRAWDPRTLDLLQHLLPAGSMHMLVPPDACWWWLGRNSGVKHLQGGPAQAEHATRLPLSDGDIEALLLAESLHSVLNVLQDMKLDVMEERTVRVIIAALRRAGSQWEITAPLDQVRFALHACLIHEAFDSDENVERAIRDMQASAQSPVRALSSFDEQAWGAVRERLGSTQTGNTAFVKEKHHG